MLIFLAVLVSAASVTTSLFYDSTDSNSLQIINGQSAGVIISADSIFESRMTIKLDLKDSSGALINNILNVNITQNNLQYCYNIGSGKGCSYSNYLTLSPAIYSNPGNYTIVSTVTGASGQSDTATLHLEVLPVSVSNNVPVITSTPITSVNESTAYSYQVVATDADNDALTYSLTQNPSWLSISSSGLISGTAPAVTADTNYAVTIRVSDSKDFATQTYNLIVRNNGIVIPPDTTPPVINIIYPVNSADYTSHITSINYTATDANLASCWYSLNNGVTNVTVLCNNLITGISSVQGANTWKIYANDTAGNIASRSVTFNVNILVIPNNPPVITSTAITSVNESTAYSYQVIATDADNDVLTYSLTTAPAWLSINSATGLISGTAPDVSANTNFNIVITVSDGVDIVTQSYTLTVVNIVSPPGDTIPPVINIISPTNGATYASHITSINYTATDANLATCWYTLDNGVTNVTTTCNALITGITSLEGTNTWRVYANDTAGNTASQTVIFTVDLPGGNNIPIITSTAVTSVNESRTYSYQVVATDADADTLVYSLTSAPVWLSINSTTGVITGITPSVSTDTNFSITVAVSDGIANVTQSYILTVNNISSRTSGISKKTTGTEGLLSSSNTEFEEQQYLDQFAPRTAISAEDSATTAGKNAFNLQNYSGAIFVIFGLVSFGLLVIFVIFLIRRL